MHKIMNITSFMYKFLFIHKYPTTFRLRRPGVLLRTEYAPVNKPQDNSKPQDIR